MKIKILLCMSLLAVSCLYGCGQKEKVSFSETYDTESTSSINMQIDSWQLKIMTSSDEAFHNLQIRINEQTVYHHGIPAPLTHHEFFALRYLAQHPSRF